MFTRGLCGFSHGASGIGTVFLELADYFKNDAFFWIAEQSFLYEDDHWNEEMHNWPDFRKLFGSDEIYKSLTDSYKAGDITSFSEVGDIAAWCHGAPGIGLSRIRAYELLKKKVYYDDILKALEKTKESCNSDSFNLCHGNGGNSLLFIEAFKIFKENKHLSIIEKVAKNALTSKQKRGMYISGYGYESEGEDLSLFIGTAGIGYFYLQALKPMDVPPILNQKLDRACEVKVPVSKFPLLSVKKGELVKRVLSLAYLRTLTLLKAISPKELSNYFDAYDAPNNGADRRRFEIFVDKIIKQLSKAEGRCLEDAYILEKRKLQLDNEIESLTLLKIKQDIQIEYFENQVDKPLSSWLNVKVKASSNVHVVQTSWSWEDNLGEEDWIRNLKTQPSIFHFMLFQTLNKTIERRISNLSVMLLDFFQESMTINEVISEASSQLEMSGKELDSVTTGIVDQIKQLVQYGALEIVDEKITNGKKLELSHEN